MEVAIWLFGIITMFIFCGFFLIPYLTRKVMWITVKRALKKIAKDPTTGSKVKDQLNEIVDSCDEASKEEKL